MTISKGNDLPASLLGVLYVISCNDLSERSTIAKTLGRSAVSEVAQLQAQGFVRASPSQRSDGTRTTLYSITVKGNDALNRRDEREASGIDSRVAGPRNPYSAQCYEGAELLPYTGRPGATDAKHLPSRMNNRLHFPDGRVEAIAPEHRSTGAA